MIRRVKGPAGRADSSFVKAPLVAALVATIGTGVVAVSPLGEPLRDPVLGAFEDYREAQAPPHRGRHLDDRADVIGPFADPIERLAAAFLEDLAIDVRVVTLRAPGEVLQVVAEGVLAEPRGAQRATTGALAIVIDAAERRARIETSYDLEGAFPDLVLKRMAADQLAPYASYNAVGMAVMDVLRVLRDQGLDEAVRGGLPLAEELRTRAAYLERAAEISGGGGAGARLPDLPADADLKRRVPAAQRGRYAPTADPWGSIESYRRVLQYLAGDPALDLFTPGSQVMRGSYPVAPYEQQRRLRLLRASHPLRLVREGDRMVAVSDQPARGFVPVLLRRDEGLWRVDLVETWKNLFFDENGEYVLYNTSMPYAFGLRHLPQGLARGLEPLDLGGEHPLMAIQRLERRGDARAHLELAELLLRNCFVPVAAFRHLEEAGRLAPDDIEIARVYGERALYLGFDQIAIRQLRRAGPGVWHRLAHAYARAGDLERAERYYRRALRRNPDSKVAQLGLRRVRKRQQTGSGSATR